MSYLFRPFNIILSDYKFLLLLGAKSAFACPAVLPGILSPIAAFYSSRKPEAPLGEATFSGLFAIC